MSIKLTFVNDNTNQEGNSINLPSFMLKDTDIVDGKSNTVFTMSIGVKFACDYPTFSYTDTDIEFIFITRLEPVPKFNESHEYTMMFVGARSGTPFFMEMRMFLDAFKNGKFYVTDKVNIKHKLLANTKQIQRNHYLEFDEDDDGISGP